MSLGNTLGKLWSGIRRSQEGTHERQKQLTDDEKLQIIKPNHKRFSLADHLEK